jgi:hypothetical protein
LFITVIGIPVGLIVGTFYVILAALATIITALVGAYWFQQSRRQAWQPAQLALVALGLFILLQILGMIPFVGWVGKIALAMIAFGAILDNSGLLRRKQMGMRP